MGVNADPDSDSDRPIVLFDGVCNLCTTSVRWILEHDRRGTLRFASLQSPAGQRLLESHGLSTENFESMLLVEGESYYEKSDAVVRIASHLGFPYSLASVGSIAPQPIRDRVYEWVAGHRYEWFGKRESCLRPTPELEARFLDDPE